MEQKVAILQAIKTHRNWATTAVCAIAGVNPGLGAVYAHQMELAGFIELIPSTRCGKHWKITKKGLGVILRFKELNRDLVI